MLSEYTVTFPLELGDWLLTVRTPPFCSAGSMLGSSLPLGSTRGILLALFPISDKSTLLVNELRLILLPRATTLPT